MWYTLIDWFRREKGQDLTEYALLVGLIFLVATTAVSFLGGSIVNFFNNVVATLQNSL